jgi:hypothetical protein
LLKKVLRVFLIAGAILLAVVAFNGISFQKKINNRPLPSFYKKGVFHLHSVFSDGLGTLEEISRDAQTQNLDFVILTDHGRPNLPATAATAWIDDTLLIGASEFSLHAGHLAAAGYRVPGYIFPPEPQEAIDEVNRDSGVTFISHPLDRKIPWTDWQVQGFTGIEILSLYQMAKKNLLYGLTLFPMQYLFNPDYALTSLISYPRDEMALWDRFNRTGHYYGIYALDSHAKLPIGKKTNLHFPSYSSTFRILNLYVKVGRELEKNAPAAAATILAALRQGNFFSTIESLAAANGFENYYLEKDGTQVEMGGNALATGGSLVLKLPFNFATDILIKKDGETFLAIEGNSRQAIAVPLSEPGVYRCEVSHHSGRFSGLPWILANPIFVARPAAAPAALAGAAKPRQVLNGAGPYFQGEKNSRSRGKISIENGEDGRPVTRFAFSLLRESPSQVDFWTALARRENLDFSKYKGFVFAVKGSRPLRFWLQFRTGDGQNESAFQHSFRVSDSWRQVAIPFARFHRLYGAEAPPDLAKVRAIFFLVDNGCSFSGAEGEISLGPVGLY